MAIDLAGKVAVVTGGGTGLGRAAAQALREAGAVVTIMGRRAEVLEDAARRIGAEPAVCDVADAASVAAAFGRVLAQRRKVDILVNAAGINIRGESLEYGADDWDRVHAVNTKGTFLCCQAAARSMRDSRYGKIVNLASLASELGFPRIAAYGSSKGGVRQLTRALAVEWAPYGIRVNGIEPGWFRTEFTEPLFNDAAWVQRVTARIPLGRTGEPGDLAGTVLYLASPLSDYVTGQLIGVDGGVLAA